MLFLTSVHFTISKLILLFSYCFHVPCSTFSNVYCYIVRSMFPFLFNWSQSKGGVVNQMSHFFFEALFFSTFLKIVIFTKLFRLWSTLKITEFFWSHLALLISTWNRQRWVHVVQCCKFQRWSTQHCFNVDLTLSDVAASYHPNNNMETTLKGFLDNDDYC